MAAEVGTLKPSTFPLELVPVSELTTMRAPYNPRRITERELEKLGKSMIEFGVVEAVVANKRTRHVVGGHQRVTAAELVGIEALPVCWVDLDLTREKQLNLALNRISGTWDEALLSSVLKEIEADGGDLSLTGFDVDEVDRYLAANFGTPEPAIPPDEFRSFDEGIDVEHTCPKCGYQWSGGR